MELHMLQVLLDHESLTKSGMYLKDIITFTEAITRCIRQLKPEWVCLTPNPDRVDPMVKNMIDTVPHLQKLLTLLKAGHLFLLSDDMMRDEAREVISNIKDLEKPKAPKYDVSCATIEQLMNIRKRLAHYLAIQNRKEEGVARVSQEEAREAAANNPFFTSGPLPKRRTF